MFRLCLVIFLGIISFFNISAFASEDFVSKASCEIEISTGFGGEVLAKESFSISRDGSERSKVVSLESTNIKLGSLAFWIEADTLNIVRYGVDKKMLSMDMARGRSFTSLAFIKEFTVAARCKM